MTAEESIQAMLERALAAHRTGAFGEAARTYESVLAREPNHADALHLLGLVKHQAGDSDAGIALIQRAIARTPAAADFQANLAGIFAARQRWADAAASMQRAGDLRPADEAFRRRLANYLAKSGVQLLNDQDRPPDAVAALERALAIRPDAADVLGNLGLALARMKRYDVAVTRYEQAIAIQPDIPELHTNLGAALLAIGRAADAVAAHRRACALRPDWPAAMSNLAIALGQVGQTDEALALHEAVLLQSPDDPTALFNRGMIRLSRGDFAGGWRDYEARFRVQELKGQRTFQQPRWKGQDVAGKTVLVHAEQGLGDTIQFVRYLPQLVSRGARVVMLCDRLLARLLRHSFPGVTVIADGDPLPTFDLHVPVMSLPFAFGTTQDTVPATVPYLSVPPDGVAQIAGRIREDGLRVGLVWSGNPGHYNDRNRSVHLEQLLPFIPSHHTLHLYSLQKGPGTEQLVSAGRSREITDLAPHLTDLADSATAIAKLDLVLTVDTSIAHLAGALGAIVWTLLPEPADFRWMTGRDDSPWYPTMRLFRQRQPGEWDEVFQRVRIALNSLL